jgi:hypothetical protein
MNKGILIIFGLLILFLLACKQKERIVKQDFGKKISDEQLEKLVLSKNREIETVKLGRLSFSFDIDGEGFKSGGTIAIIRDSVIIVSLVPVMGYEVSRIFCYKDTILVLDRLEKTFFYTSLKRNTNKYKIQGDYDDIESLLEGRAFVYGNDKAGGRLKAKVEREDSTLKLYYDIFENETIKTRQEISVREEGLVTEKNNISDRINNSDINIAYDQFKNVEGFIFPHEVSIMANSQEKKLSIRIEIGNIVINERINAENTIPAKYEEAIIDY